MNTTNSFEEGKVILINKPLGWTSFDVIRKIKTDIFPSRLNLSINKLKNFSIVLSNDIGEEVVIGYDKKDNKYYIDRIKSGKTDFQKDFAAKHTAPRLTNDQSLSMSLIIDASSVELFADNGLTVMTEIFFPNQPYNQVHIQSPDNVMIKKLEYSNLKSIWK